MAKKNQALVLSWIDYSYKFIMKVSKSIYIEHMNLLGKFIVSALAKDKS